MHTIDKIQQLRQALWDNRAGCPLATVHRDDLFTLLDDVERMLTPPVMSIPLQVEEPIPPAPSVPPSKRRRQEKDQSL